MNSKKDIIILGAGVIGVTSAWFLRQAGFDVTVIDRQPSVANETSKANGGQISVSHAEPWATPHAPSLFFQSLFDSDAPLRYRPSLDATCLRWGLQFLSQCSASNSRANTEKLVKLGIYSRSVLLSLRDELQLSYQQKTQGILHFYTDKTLFDRAQHSANLMTQFGCEREILTVEQTLNLAPSLASITSLVGATYTAEDESGNAYLFTQALAEKCQQAGVQFLFDTHVDELHTQRNKVDKVFLSNKNGSFEMSASHFLVCMGSYSPTLLDKICIKTNIYPAKGYSATYSVTNPDKVPEVSMIDDAYKLVFSRFQDDEIDVLRVAGMAEIRGGQFKYDTSIDLQRAELVTQRVQELFPTGLDFTQPNYWTGLRPSTPSNVPHIGATIYANLFLNTGHGTLGWTHSCGSAKLITDIICGKKTALLSFV